MNDEQAIHERHAEEKLVSAVKELCREKRREVEEKFEHLKSDAAQRWDSPDFIWERLLDAFATWGSSRGVELVDNPSLHDPIRYQALINLSPEKRLATLMQSLTLAKVRYNREKRAEWLVENFERIQAEGGPDAVKLELEAMHGRDAKIKFLRTFRGIGPKHARNMMMITHHPDFRESIAVDARIKKVSETLGLNFGTYEETEEFFLSAARRAGLTGWELDRLLYWFKDDVLRLLRG